MNRDYIVTKYLGANDLVSSDYITDSLTDAKRHASKVVKKYNFVEIKVLEASGELVQVTRHKSIESIDALILFS